VLARDAVWCEDTTHLGRLCDFGEVSGEVITDRATLSTVSLSVGAPPTSKDAIEDLERAAARRGGWPLVLQHDRASIYGAQEVRDRLALERVVALISRVHTPTDNPVAEHVKRELKEESHLGTGVVLPSDAAAAERLSRAESCLRVRPRASRGFRTAAELDRELPRGDTLVERARFYGEACSAIEQAVLGHTDPNAIRKAEQDAIWRTLEKHQLARLHLGPRRAPCPRRAPAASGRNG
jgi:transposase InsO family protein